ncbi:MAG: toll/interleukin-1 receptor domain-containing protein [Prevotellaceae bacterium]|nr:toll/interleukin-1 receptor domain-containing protein [Prevotellaceae bacterium]
MSTDFEYSAFISYKREDEKWAIWLQNHLEHYSIPSTIRKEIPRLPKHIKPVFRDKTDLCAGGLAFSLHKELERSHFLIVICSPHSACSDWVGKEIEYFRILGRENYIIPFIVDGIPHCEDASKECFHPIFNNFHDEPLGINIKEIGKQQALVKVLAKILDLRFDILWGRHKRYLLRRKIKNAISVLLICIIGLVYWFYSKPLYKYYADYVDRWGIPEGIIELDESIVQHRYRSYRFEYRRIPIGEPDAFSWRLSRVELINSAGIPQDYQDGDLNDRYAIMKIDYNSSSGTPKHIDFQNKAGKALMRWKVSSKDGVRGTLVDFIGITDTDASGYLGASSTMSHVPSDVVNIHKSSIKRYVLERDSHGFVISKSYHSSNADNIESSKTTDVNGVYKQVFVNDTLGRVLSTKYYAINDILLNRSNGVAIQNNQYDTWGNRSQTEYFNSEDKPVLNEELFTKKISMCDKWGNIVKEQYYSTDGNLCFNKDNYSQSIITFNNNGFPVSVSYYDNNSQPCRHREGYAKLIIKCDSRGNPIENHFEDITGKACANIYGIAKLSVEYDRWANPTYMAFYGLNGRLAQNGEGVSGRKHKYDRYGNCIQTDFFDVEWNACLNNMGFASLKTEYDNRGFPQKYVFYDLKGEKTLCNNGFASIKYHYNDRGNPIEFAYYGVDDVPCMNNWGFHKVKNQYDELGNLIQFQYYDIMEHLCLSNEQFASCDRFPDSLGNIKRWIYYDINGKPTKDIYGVCDYRWQFDEFGRATQVRYFDENGNHVVSKDGTAGWNAKYDSRGNQIEYVNIGVNGEICSDSTGVAWWVKEFDQRGNQLSYAVYDVNNNLKAGPNGVAFWKSEFNNWGLLLKTVYYNEDGVPCINTDIGYSYYVIQYNKNMDPIEICTYDENRNLCNDPKTGYARWVAKYDKNWNRIEMLSYSEKDSLCTCKYGYARWRAKYDKDGNITESFSYDDKGNSIASKEEADITKEKDVRKYDSHRFKYDTADIILGFFFLAVLLVVLWFWLKNILSNTITQNLLCSAGVIFLMGFDYLYLRRFLLHFALIPYNIYNYTWILCLVASLICFAVSLVLLYLLIHRIVAILKVPRHVRKYRIKEAKDMLIMCPIAIVWLAFVIYSIANEGWSIYSNPL